MHRGVKAPATRLLTVDDHPAVRHGVEQLLAADQRIIVEEAESHQEALARIRQGGIGLVLLDISLEGSSGFELLSEVEELDIPIVVYSMHETPEIVGRAMRWGALGYVTKREKPKVLAEAVEAVLAGQRFLSPRAAQALAESATEAAPINEQKQSLSEREHQILKRLGQGDARQEIAAALGISSRTVETYCARLIQKSGLANMKALRKYAISLYSAS